MIWILVVALLVAIVWLSFGSGFKDVSEKRLVYDFMHDNEPSYWVVIKAIKDSDTMDELNKSYEVAHDTVKRFCDSIRVMTPSSDFGETVADKYYEGFRDAINDTIIKIKAKLAEEVRK